jgi:non-specific serine/threonine protein kinase
VSSGGPPARLRDAKGLAHLHRLLAAPHGELHALDLTAGAAGRGAGATTRAAATAGGLGIRARGTGDAGPALDAAAKSAYRDRIAELQREIDEARSAGTAERAREELAFVRRELTGAVGLGGRDRPVASDAERARVNVTRAIRTAIRRIAAADPDLGAHLDAAVKTGTFCVYAPAAGDELTWDLAGPS